MTNRKNSTQTLRPAFLWIACLICSLASFTFSVAPTTVLAIRSMSVCCSDTLFGTKKEKMKIVFSSNSKTSSHLLSEYLLQSRYVHHILFNLLHLVGQPLQLFVQLYVFRLKHLNIFGTNFILF